MNLLIRTTADDEIEKIGEGDECDVLNDIISIHAVVPVVMLILDEKVPAMLVPSSPQSYCKMLKLQSFETWICTAVYCTENIEIAPE